MTTILVTGATDGIGLATARALAAQGATVLAHGRNPAKLGRVCEELDCEGLLADLSSMDQVRQLAVGVKEHGFIDVLLHNAGVWCDQHTVTPDGFELTMAVNHFAPFLLTHLLSESIVAGGRVVTVSSIAHGRGRIHWDDLELRDNFTPFGAYAQSKLANILFANALARRLRPRGITSNSLHPGVIDTKLLRSGFDVQGAPVDTGSATSVHLALSPDVAKHTGCYFDACRERIAEPAALDEGAQERFWFRSGERLGLSVA
jgi:NAD(P)-dependent dehydrogenase (short-subunit alcohol dehydrogenase family)